MHSPEPWSITDGNDLVDCSGSCLEARIEEERQGEFHCGLSMDDMERIVACVNFCRGHKTEDLMRCCELDPELPTRQWAKEAAILLSQLRDEFRKVFR